jgi:Spy/CpxP family protein refolding chaperone
MKTATKVILGFFTGAGVAMAVTVAAAHKMGGEHGWHGDRSERMVGWVEHHLDLDSAQSEQLQQLMAQAKTLRMEWREQRSDTMLQVRELIANPTLDQQQALAMIESKMDQAKAQAPEMIAAVAAFADSLSAEQKQEVLAMLDQRAEHGRGGRAGHHRH